VSSILHKASNNLYLVGVLAAKDIIEALRSKLVLTLIITLSIMLLMPRLMGLIIQPAHTSIALYDPSYSQLSTELEASPQFNPVEVSSISEFDAILDPLGSGLGVAFGLAVPPDFDQRLAAGGELQVEGYVAWGNRFNAQELKTEFESRLSKILGAPLHINTANNLVYPNRDAELLLGFATISVILILLMKGISLVPHLLFEEKQTHTMDSLLVSPASIGQVVAGKALAGAFYVLVASCVVFALYWAGVVHWGAALLFALGCALFSVGTGLVLGSFFDSQQEIVGWVSLILVLLTGAMLASFMQLEVPNLIQSIIPWVPSVALAEVFLSAFLEYAQWDQVWINLGGVLLLSIVLYALVVWKVSRMDR
jgi:ABC-2 type transport system permease protein